MLARRVLPASYLEWNQRWSAPHGSAWTRRLGRRWWTSPIAASLVGPFAFQANNDTRRVEYPWAYDALALVPGLNVLEVGGGLSGFQFALSRCGCRVTNVDPADETAVHWPLDRRTLGLLNRRFGTSVMLKQCFVQEAGLTADAFDRAVSISVIEHIRREDIVVVLDHVRRALKPGGRFVLTIDLFLDLVPFTSETQNKFGTNISVEWLVRESGLALVHGEPRELYGFPDFEPDEILAQKDRYYVGQGWPTMVQTLVLAKQRWERAAQPTRMAARSWPLGLLRAALRRALPARIIAAYREHQAGEPMRDVVWHYLHGLPDFSLLTRTRHGWMTYSNKDLAIGRLLFLEGHFEYELIARTIVLLRELALPRGGLLVDVGANIGTVTLTLLREGIFGHAIAVEPTPGNYRRLARNLWLNGLRHRVRPIQGAAGSESGTVHMTLSPTNHGDHRMRPSTSLGPERMMESAWPSVDVRCDRLDDIVAERPDLLWMDVQGSELRVLQGAPRLLAAGVPVVMEFAPYWIAQAGIDVTEFCEFFSARFGTFFDLRAPMPTRVRAAEITALFERYSALEYSDLLVLPP